jgi:hypothetical protein
MALAPREQEEREWVWYQGNRHQGNRHLERQHQG